MRLGIVLVFLAIWRHFFYVALEAEERPAIPARARDVPGDGAEACVGFAAPREALFEHEHLMQFPVPFAEELRALGEPGRSGFRWFAVRLTRLLQ